MKTLYKTFLDNVTYLQEDDEIKNHIEELAVCNMPLYVKKRKLREYGFHCPATISTWTIVYLTAGFFIILLPGIALFSSNKINGYIFIGVFLTYIFGIAITRALAGKAKFKTSPLVNNSLYHKMFVGGTDTKWYKYGADTAVGAAMDEIEDGALSPVNVFYMAFIWGEDDNVTLSEISKDEYNLINEYDFDSAAIGICGHDIVGVYLYKEGAEWYEALPKISEKQL